MKDRQNSRGTDRTSSIDSETSTDSRVPAPQVRVKLTMTESVGTVGQVQRIEVKLCLGPVFLTGLCDLSGCQEVCAGSVEPHPVL